MKQWQIDSIRDRFITPKDYKFWGYIKAISHDTREVIFHFENINIKLDVFGNAEIEKTYYSKQYKKPHNPKNQPARVVYKHTETSRLIPALMIDPVKFINTLNLYKTYSIEYRRDDPEIRYNPDGPFFVTRTGFEAHHPELSSRFNCGKIKILFNKNRYDTIVTDCNKRILNAVCELYTIKPEHIMAIGVDYGSHSITFNYTTSAQSLSPNPFTTSHIIVADDSSVQNERLTVLYSYNYITNQELLLHSL